MDKLNEAIAKAKSGDKVTAGKMLSEFVRENPSSETAWLWLSICVSPVEQKRFCLNKALSINPLNENARKALEQLDAPLSPPPPSFAELSDNQPALQQPPQPTSRTTQSANMPASNRAKIPSIPMENVGEYIRSILMPNERVLATAQIHWVIFMTPVIFTVLAIFSTIAAFASNSSASSTNSPGDSSMAMLLFSSNCCIPFWLIGIIGFVLAFVRIKTTEFALTDKRVIGKSGIIKRGSLELVLGKVESISVNQNILGRIFDFGTLVVTGSGGTHQVFHYIAEPMTMKKTINLILAE
jgi:hypothetical protein